MLAPRICNGDNDNLDKQCEKIAFKQESSLLVSPFEDLCLEFAQEAWCSLQAAHHDVCACYCKGFVLTGALKIGVLL